MILLRCYLQLCRHDIYSHMVFKMIFKLIFLKNESIYYNLKINTYVQFNSPSWILTIN
jgi:hypothetical protein